VKKGGGGTRGGEKKYVTKYMGCALVENSTARRRAASMETFASRVCSKLGSFWNHK
jgi:hypothetical protein